MSDPKTGGTPTAPAALSAATLAYLNEINGQDTYNAKSEAIGKLAKRHYLKVPLGFTPNAAEPEVMGSANACPGWSAVLYAQVYVLNKPVFEDGEQAIRGALLRAEMVKAGWYTSSYEVEMVAVPPNFAEVFEADFDVIKEIQPDAAELAMLLPLAAEHTFRTMGHHYLSGLAPEYKRKYSQFFNASVKPHLTNYLPAEILYHRVGHWTPLDLALEVAKCKALEDRLPNSVKIRATSAPAGSALIATSAAVLEALLGTGVGRNIGRASGLNVSLIMDVSAAVKNDPGKYHVISSAYNAEPLSANEAKQYAEAKETAIQLAPVLQGFIDSLPRTSDLTGAKSLAKHADINPLMRKRAKAFFREVGTTKATTLAELFAMDARAAEATGGEAVIGDELDDAD